MTKQEYDNLPEKAIAYSIHPKIKNYPILYVSSLPGHGGVDWGYTKKIEGEFMFGKWLDKAFPLNRYWQRRFAKHCEDTNMIAHFLGISS